MKKTALLLSLLSILMIVRTSAQNDSILLATYEPGELIDRTYGDAISTVTNPVQDAINNSVTVLKFVKATQWSSFMILNNFGVQDNPVSLYQYPFIKFCLMSDSALSKSVRVEVIDINGYSTSINAPTTSPSAINQWVNMTVDFTPALTSTPISLVKEIRIFIDYGISDPLMSRYYIDNVRFTNPKASSLTSSTAITLLQETFGDNAWFDGITDDPDGSGGTGAIYDLISKLKTAAWGGSPFAGTPHYNDADSLKFIRTDWGGSAAICVYPATTRQPLSYFYLNNFNVGGDQNLIFSYDLYWHDAPASYTNSMTVEYQIDGGAWTAVTTSSPLPSSTGSWTKDITYPLSGVVGNNINFRVTNNTIARAWLDNFKFTITKIFADSVKISNPPVVNVAVGKTLQLSSTVYQSNASQEVSWYIYSGNGTINSSGLYTATKSGDVKVRAMCTSLPNLYGEISLHNYNAVDSVKVTAENDATSINVAGGTLQLYATVKPDTAENKTVTWSVNNSSVAMVDPSTGLLTALANGSVIVTAAATDGSNVTGAITIDVTNQLVTGINNVELANVNIYPTLVTNKLIISGSTNFKHIEIFNSQGKLMKRIYNVSTGSEIILSNLSSGIYMMHITDDRNFSTTKRFVKE